jgi:hypothetical protein
MIASWEDFFAAVERMRTCQKTYFVTKSHQDFLVAKKTEAEVDNCIKQRREKEAARKQPVLLQEDRHGKT